MISRHSGLFLVTMNALFFFTALSFSLMATAANAKSHQENADIVWQKYLDTIDFNNIQLPGCKPIKLTPSKDVYRNPKGIVVLFHGFTSCPQQWESIGKQLAKAGHLVYIPLLPGHGIKRVPSEQHLQSLPRIDLKQNKSFDAKLYQKFIRKINLLASSYGEKMPKVIAGLSGGGALAVETALNATSPWDQMILLAPLLDTSHVLQSILKVTSIFRPNHVLHYGEQCIKETHLGRAGYCEVNTQSLQYMINLGKNAFNTFEKEGLTIKSSIMVVGIEDDYSVNNDNILKFNQIAEKHRTKSYTCFFSSAVPHSMVSRFENLHTDQHWIPRLESYIIRYIEDRVPFPYSHSQNNDFMECRL